MTTTTNFGFNIPDGSDNVNLLTQNYPNWTNLDAILKAIKDTGITAATATKTGTNFAVVRSDADCKFLAFVATANFVAGDTFTVDGVPVTTTTPAGTALPNGAFVINQSVLACVNGGVLTAFVGGGLSSVDADDVSYDNAVSGLTASDVQAAIDELVTTIGAIPVINDAGDVSYDNTVSGLTATNVQDAIDELAGSAGNYVYSTTEHVVGKWIDDSTVYERTYTGTGTWTGSGDITIDAAMNTANTQLIAAEGYYTASNIQKPIFDEFRSGNGNACIPKLDSSRLYVSWSAGSGTMTKYAFTVRYIKIS